VREQAPVSIHQLSTRSFRRPTIWSKKSIGLTAARARVGTGLSPLLPKQVIQDGKLAVVLGVEAANAYGTCQIYGRGNVPGIPNLIGAQNPEGAWGIDCTEGGGAVAGPVGGLLPGFENWPRSFAIAYFEHYWDQGPRHFYLIHNLPGAGGGNSLSVPLLHATNNPSRISAGGMLNRVPDIDRVVAATRPPFHHAGVLLWNLTAADATPQD
jgi:hypothetical protein